MSGRTFVDTNILICAHDLAQGAKQTAADGVLRELWTNQTGVLSPQVLQEFYYNATRKGARPLSRNDARRIVATYSVWCIDFSQAELFSAFQVEDMAKISFWDSLIIAAALKAGATTILSEDMNSGQTIAGIRIVNPLVVA